MNFPLPSAHSTIACGFLEERTNLTVVLAVFTFSSKAKEILFGWRRIISQLARVCEWMGDSPKTWQTLAFMAYISNFTFFFHLILLLLFHSPRPFFRLPLLEQLINVYYCFYLIGIEIKVYLVYRVPWPSHVIGRFSRLHCANNLRFYWPH